MLTNWVRLDGFNETMATQSCPVKLYKLITLPAFFYSRDEITIWFFLNFMCAYEWFDYIDEIFSCLYDELHTRFFLLSYICFNGQLFLHIHYWPIGHVNVESCLLIIFQYQLISWQFSWLSVEKSIRIDRVLYKHHWEFPIHKKIIPMLICPITSCEKSVFCYKA